MNGTGFQTARLGREHNRSGFYCGEPALDEYFHRYAGQDTRRGVSKVFVALEPDSNEVIGFYSLSAYSADLVDLPTEMQKNLPKYEKVPTVLLGRLAIHKRAQGRRTGGYLLQDALRRALKADIGWAVFLVSAKHEQAASFYRHFEFQPFDRSPLFLYIKRKTASAVCGIDD